MQDTMHKYQYNASIQEPSEKQEKDDGKSSSDIANNKKVQHDTGDDFVIEHN